VFRFENYFAIEFVNNLVRNYKTQAYSVFVQLLPVLNEPKQLEKFRLIFFFDSNACVFYRYHEEKVLTNPFHFDKYGDPSFCSKLECIRLKTKKHLHHSLFVSSDQWAVMSSFQYIFMPMLAKVLVNSLKVYTSLFCFVSLDAHDFFDTVPDVEYAYVLTELSCLDLCVV
jgi:hypothetical protein